MTTIIPIPAFRDNYIWAVRNGRARGGRRSGRRGAGARVARRARHRAVRDRRHASPCATTSAASRRCCARYDVPGVRTGARGDSRAHARARRGRPRSTFRASASRSPCSTFRATRRDTSRTTRPARPAAVLRRHAVRGRMRPPVRRHARSRCGRRCRSSPRCRRPRASTAGTNTRSPTCASRAAVEPANAAFAHGRARERDKRERDLPTLPSTIARRARDQSLPARGIAGRDGRRRSARRSSASPTPLTRSRRCARGRTTSGEIEFARAG